VTTANITVPSEITISSSTNASPIEITTSASHGLSSGDTVCVTGHATNTNANGWWLVGTVVSGVKFTLTGSTGNGVGGATGSIFPAGLSPFPPQPGLDPDKPFGTSPTKTIYQPWENVSGTTTDAQFVSNATR